MFPVTKLVHQKHNIIKNNFLYNTFHNVEKSLTQQVQLPVYAFSDTWLTGNTNTYSRLYFRETVKQYRVLCSECIAYLSLVCVGRS